MDDIDDRTPERKRLDTWSAENPRDQLGLVALAAWLNTTPDKLPKEMRLHTCQSTKDAWARVEAAIRADLAQAPAPVRVKPLDFVYGKAESIVGNYLIDSGWKDKIAGERWWAWVGPKFDESDPFYAWQYGTRVGTEEAAKAAAQADYEARIMAALEAPDAGWLVAYGALSDDAIAALAAEQPGEIALLPLDAGVVAELVEAIGAEARRYAAFYPHASDGQNTFVMFAEWVEQRALAIINKQEETRT